MSHGSNDADVSECRCNKPRHHIRTGSALSDWCDQLQSAGRCWTCDEVTNAPELTARVVRPLRKKSEAGSFGHGTHRPGCTAFAPGR